MNATVKRIRDIIKSDVCRACEAESWVCKQHRRRCNTRYEMQALEIYRQIVEPMESNQPKGGGEG